MNSLAVDIGNTSISLCLFKDNKLFASKKISQSEFNFKKLNSLKKKFFNKNVNKIIISSVVPKCDFIFKEFLTANSLNFYFLKKIRKNIKLKINLKKKDEIGDDRIANIILAKEKFNKSVIIVDFGTATTLDVLNNFGVYHGGVITPGIEVSLNTLKNKTAKLPLVKFARTKKVIGFNTKQAIQSGFFWGYCSMIEGLIKKIIKEENNEFQIILTGGNSSYFHNVFENVILIDEFFTSKALNYILNKYT